MQEHPALVVVHLHRPIADVVKHLTEDPTRPYLGSPVEEVKDCLFFILIQPPRTGCGIAACPITRRSRVRFLSRPGERDLAAAEREFAGLLRFAAPALAPGSRHPFAFEEVAPLWRPVGAADAGGFFVSLTWPDLEAPVAAGTLAAVAAGADAVELRVDLLRSTDASFLASQVSMIRRHVGAPIIFTVRSAGQGGAFKDDERAITDRAI